MISCDRHDYIEIACMYHFLVELTLKDGKCVTGVAQTVALDEKRKECIKLTDKGESAMIVLTELASMRALKTNPHFDVVTFDE